MDGVSVLRRLRAAQIATPVLLLTALGHIAGRVEGLEAGADDYLVKPFAFSELAAPLNAVSRRAVSGGAEAVFEAGNLKLDLRKFQVTRGGAVIPLRRAKERPCSNVRAPCAQEISLPRPPHPSDYLGLRAGLRQTGLTIRLS